MALEDELAAFTGMTRYHQNRLGLVYTDGVRHLVERAEAHWLLDVVASHQPQLQGIGFQLWKLEKKPDGTAVLAVCEDDGRPELIHQEIEYTDFPFNSFSFYVLDGVMQLESEY